MHHKTSDHSIDPAGLCARGVCVVVFEQSFRGSGRRTHLIFVPLYA